MQCTQCGCVDLIKVKFPYNTSLILTDVGLYGETNVYDIKNKENCKSFICLNCGHFEFFNLSMAKQLRLDIKKKEEVEENINKLNNELTELVKTISDKQAEIKKLDEESLNLDISVRRYNEIRSLIADIKNDITNINKLIKEKEKEITKLKKIIK